MSIFMTWVGRRVGVAAAVGSALMMLGCAESSTLASGGRGGPAQPPGDGGSAGAQSEGGSGAIGAGAAASGGAGATSSAGAGATGATGGMASGGVSAGGASASGGGPSSGGTPGSGGVPTAGGMGGTGTSGASSMGGSMTSGGMPGVGGTQSGAGGSSGSGTGGTGPSGCVVQSFRFDASNEGWSGSGNNSSWSWGAPSNGPGADHSGSGSLWATNLSGNPNTCESSYLTSPNLDLSAYAGQTVRVRFWHWHHFRECSLLGRESYSGGRFEVNGGGGWVEVQPTGGYGGEKIGCSGGNSSCDPCAVDDDRGFNGYTADQQQWNYLELDISAHLSASTSLRFVFGNHQSYGCSSNNRAGWYIDDVDVFVVGSCN